MEYNQLMSVLKKERLQNCSGNDLIYEIIEQEHPSRYVYNKLTQEENVFTKLQSKWQKELEFSEEELEEALQNIQVMAYISKMCSFQYRLLHRTLPTNIQRMYWGKAQNDMCTFCGNLRETYVHMFVECEKVRVLWELVKTIAKNMHDDQPHLSKKP